jgi:molybdopterin molybdotransferase
MTAVKTSDALPASPQRVLGYAEAAELVRRHARLCAERTGKTESVPLLAGAGRILREAIVADRDQPPFPRSTRDGFACRAAELAKTAQGGTLKVLGVLRAGESWQQGEIEPGEAVEIMTGAPVPAGADCVAMVEHAQVQHGGVRLTAPRAPEAGENIVPTGAEARAGAIVVPAGTRMGIGQIAAAAACGYAAVQVSVKPRVAILATGDELVDVSGQPLTHQIRNSNSFSLAAQVAARGGEPVLFPIVRDNAAETAEAIREALHCDLILLTGGVSMGKYDFVEQALLTLGAEFFFTGAKIQPGKPVVFGRVPDATGGKYFFGLPGNPLSTMVTFALFAAPLLAVLAGATQDEPRFLMGRLDGDVTVKPGLTRFLPAQSEGGFEGTVVRAVEWRGSGDLASAARADCFLVVPEDRERLADGEMVSGLLI